MFRNFTLALLGSASCLCAGIQQAAAIDGAALPEPKVIYARDPAAPPAPVRVASSNMGGGFIQFLFGDGPRSQRYQGDENWAHSGRSWDEEAGRPIPGPRAGWLPPAR